MHSFKDKKSKVWNLQVDMDVVERVQSMTKFDVLTLIEEKGATTLGDDRVLLCRVIYAALKPEADAAGLDGPAFFKQMDGDAIDGATEALIQAVIDFFQSSKRPGLRRVFQIATAAAAKVQKEALAKLEKIPDKEIEREIVNQLTTTRPSTP